MALYRIGDGEHVSLATPRPIAPAEMADMRATPDRLEPGVVGCQRRGAIRWLASDGVPDLRQVDAGRADERSGLDRRSRGMAPTP